MELWIWAILLLVVGASLAVMEVFFPSAGILGFLSAVSVLSAVVMGFYSGPLAGVLILMGALIGLPTVIVLGFRYWPKTAMGRRVLLIAPTSEEVLPDDTEKQFLRSLIGKTGRAKSKMLLSGAILIEGRTVDAISESIPVEAGQAVQVIQVRGHGVVVRPVEKKEEASPVVDPLEQTYDDPFDAPPA